MKPLALSRTAWLRIAFHLISLITYGNFMSFLLTDIERYSTRINSAREIRSVMMWNFMIPEHVGWLVVMSGGSWIRVEVNSQGVEACHWWTSLFELRWEEWICIGTTAMEMFKIEVTQISIYLLDRLDCQASSFSNFLLCSSKCFQIISTWHHYSTQPKNLQQNTLELIWTKSIFYVYFNSTLWHKWTIQKQILWE